MKLFLCRHGETDFNVQKRLQGVMETPINGHGKLQARLVAEKLAREGFDYAFCSPLVRCRQTAEEIMRHQKGMQLVYREELKEVDLGKYAGMDRHEIEEKFPGDWAKRVDNKYRFVHEGGESYEEADLKRVKPLLAEFREKYSSRKILVITHAGIARLIVGNLLGLHAAEKMRVEFPNDCIYTIDYLPHKTTIRHFLAETGKTGEGYLTK